MRVADIESPQVERLLREVTQARRSIFSRDLILEGMLYLGEAQVSKVPAAIMDSKGGRLRVDKRECDTSFGNPWTILVNGPRRREEAWVVSGFAALGISQRLRSVPQEKKRGFIRSLIHALEWLYSKTPYDPFMFIEAVATTEETKEVWDELVAAIIENANSGEGSTEVVLLMADALKHVMEDRRVEYTRRLLSEVHEPNIALALGASVTGGQYNEATGVGSSISGGLSITMGSNYGWAAGTYSSP